MKLSGILTVIFLCYLAVEVFAARSNNIYTGVCELKTNNMLADRGKNGLLAEISLDPKSFCECMGNAFSSTNGKLRMALFDSGLIGPTDFTKPGADVESKCLQEAFDKVESSVKQ